MKRIFPILILSSLLFFSFPAGAQVRGERSESIVAIDGESYYVHTVKRGETAYSLCMLYIVSEEALIASNPHVVEGLKEGQVLKIPLVRDEEKKVSGRKAGRIFDTHTVIKGETLYSISKLYEIPIKVLLEDNEGLDPASLPEGRKLNIRKESRGEVTDRDIVGQLENYRDAINSVSENGVYHLVERKETIYSLSRLYGVSEEEIIRENNLTDGLKAGALIRIPVKNPDFKGNTGRSSVDPLSRVRERTLEAGRRERTGSGNIIADISDKRVVNIVLLLPLENEKGTSGKSFVEFYRGFLMGLEDMKAEGTSTRLTLYNTGRDSGRMEEIIRSDDFRSADIIVGPVYEESLPPVVAYAEDRGIAVVSPLAPAETVSSPVLYRMSPPVSFKYDKLLESLKGDINIVYVTTPSADPDMEQSVRPRLPFGVPVVAYDRSMRASAFEDMIDRARENVFIVSSNNELYVDDILAKLSSIQNNITSRTGTALDIRVVGNPSWTRFKSSMDTELFFKLNLCYVTNYHADRSDDRVTVFDGRYIDEFNEIPTLYSYRGYDTAKLFVGAAKMPGADFTSKLNNLHEPPLQMSYRFGRTAYYGTNVNTNWALVCYRNDYTIEVR